MTPDERERMNWLCLRIQEEKDPKIFGSGFVSFPQVKRGLNRIILSMANNDRDDKRLKKQIADKDGVRNTVDDIPTRKDTDNLPMEDEHEKLPNDDS